MLIFFDLGGGEIHYQQENAECAGNFDLKLKILSVRYDNLHYFDERENKNELESPQRCGLLP